MKDYIEERAIQIGLFVVEKGATVRQAARQFGISKSTVHKDITTRLIHVQPELARQAQAVLQINKAERHIRGGLATKNKYKNSHSRWPGYKREIPE